MTPIRVQKPHLFRMLLFMSPIRVQQPHLFRMLRVTKSLTHLQRQVTYTRNIGVATPHAPDATDQPVQNAPHDCCTLGRRLHHRLCSPQQRECPQDACVCQACSDFCHNFQLGMLHGTGTRLREQSARQDAAAKVICPFFTRSELPMYMSYALCMVHQ